MAWEDAGESPNLRKFLDFLGKAEGAGYDTIVGGSRFQDYSRHPGVVGLRTAEGPSTAAGRYQITKTTYNDVAPRLGISDFRPESQDAIAVELIKRKGALGDVLEGRYEDAVKKLGATWASLPSSPYSQPKRDWNFVNTNLGTSPKAAEGGWEDAPASNSGGWEDAPEAPKKAQATTPAPQAPKAAPEAPKAPAEAPKKPKGLLRQVDDAVRGAADMLTFGYADEIAAKLDSLVGGGQSGKKSYDEALAAQRARDKEGGAERIVGQIGGALLPSGVAIQAAAGATKLARAGAGAATGAIQGGLYGAGSAEGDVTDRLKEGAKGAAVGGVVGGALSAILPTTVKQEANRLIRNAGDDVGARMDAEIIKDIQKIAQSPTQRGNPITAAQLNAVESRYIKEVEQALGGLPKDIAKPVRGALQNRRALGPEDIEGLRALGTPGEAAADAILKAQRARSMTQAMQSSGGVLPMAREIVDYLPIPAGVNRGLKAMLGGRETREVAAQKVLKRGDAADEVLARLGPSGANDSLEALRALAEQAKTASAAKATAGKATRAAKEVNPNAAISELQSKDPSYLLGLGNPLGAPRNTEQMSEFSKVIRQQMEARAAREAAGVEKAKLISELAKGPKVDPKIQVLQDTRRPLSGAFQELLPGGRANLNLTSDQAIDALRLTSRQFKDRPVGQAAQSILKSGNVPDEAAFYGLQNQLRKLQEQGVIGKGALSEATQSSGIRNPVSYAANVRNAEAALKTARDAAPTKELAQFASSIARIKPSAEKAQAVADRLAKTTDPAERAFLEELVVPLTNFGKK